MAGEEGSDGKELEVTERPSSEEEDEKEKDSTTTTTPPKEASSSPNPYVSSSFLSACSSLDVRKIRETLEKRGLDPNVLLDKQSQNGLHYAVACSVWSPSRQSSILKYLLKRGLNINQARETDGWTPIFLAVTFGYHSIVSWLLSKGAKVNLRDKDSRTPEELAHKYRMHKIKDTLIHHRSRVPHSRFSCVLSGPAISSPVFSSPQETTSPPPSSSAATETSTPSKEEGGGEGSELLQA